MSIKIRFENPALENLLRRTKKTAAGVTESARAGVSAVSKKAGDRVTRAKLNKVMEDLQYEIELQMQAIGSLIYATHKGRPSGSGEIQQILEYVDGLYEQMEGHAHQLKLMEGVQFCQGCGTENEGDSVYCHECGQPLGSQEQTDTNLP